VNCAAIPRDLVESEMFGHERGAFTGATDRRIGRFELADQGTLFMDEVGDLGAEAQAKLLRAIEAKEIERVGGGKPIPVNVRIVAATNKDLEKHVADGLFREDLYFRLNVIPMTLPPLRDRADDVEALVRHFSALGRARGSYPAPRWTAGALDLMRRYRWPGNVRELANIVERLGILHAGAEVTATDVGAVLAIDRSVPASAMPAVADTDKPLGDALDDFERVLISQALAAANGNVAEAARRLRTDRPNLYRRMRRLSIEWNGT
jgi:two-component system nitrogen regulation response regulator NtrX